VIKLLMALVSVFFCGLCVALSFAAPPNVTEAMYTIREGTVLGTYAKMVRRGMI
jgi:hypothetical protein